MIRRRGGEAPETIAVFLAGAATAVAAAHIGGVIGGAVLSALLALTAIAGHS